MKGFFAWIGRGLCWAGTRLIQRQDSIESREDVTFKRALGFADTTDHRLDKAYDRMDKQDEKIDLLRMQNAEQAAQINVQRQRIDECQEHHKQCEEDRKALAQRVDELEKVTGTK